MMLPLRQWFRHEDAKQTFWLPVIVFSMTSTVCGIIIYHLTRELLYLITAVATFQNYSGPSSTNALEEFILTETS